MFTITIYNATSMENELQCIEIWAKLVPFLGIFKMRFPSKRVYLKYETYLVGKVNHDLATVSHCPMARGK